MEIDLNNMIFRVEDLTMEKVMEEYGISESKRRENPGLYKLFIEDFIPTREDLERKIDEEGLKELCLRLPCRVLMNRWNPVEDFVAQFTRQGRIPRWTKEKTQKLLVKAVHIHKDKCLYSDYDIRMQREREWCERKKENLMRLAVWEYDKNQQLQKRNEQPAVEEEEEEVESNSCPMHLNDESNINDTLKKNVNDDPRNDKSHEHGDDDVTDDDELNSSTQSDYMESLIINENEDIIQEEDLTTQAITSKVVSSQNIIASSSIVNVEAMMAEIHDGQVECTPSDILPIRPLSQSTTLNSTDFNSNVLISASPIKPNTPTLQNTEELAGEEYMEMVQQLNSGSQPRLIDYVNVNTQSMNFENCTSQEMFSQECTPEYCEFNTHISMTSTQSPSA